MCYLIREHEAGAAEGADATRPGSPAGLRPRWVGVAAAALVGSLAMAAIVAPPAASPLVSAKDAAAPASITAAAVATPTPAVVERGSMPIDDGVPSPTDAARAGIGHCEHAL